MYFVKEYLQMKDYLKLCEKQSEYWEAGYATGHSRELVSTIKVDTNQQDKKYIAL